MSCTCHRNPLHCVVPPYMLEKLASKGKSANARERALKSLRISRFFRTTRLEAQNAFQALGFRAIASAAATAAPDKLIRKVYNAGGAEELPGKLVRDEGAKPTRDTAVDAVYDGAGHTYSLYRDEYGRRSIDDRGMEIIQTVHFGEGYQNAFWNGEQMVYGDGDGTVFGDFTSDIDVIGHELSHGVTQYEAGLVYEFQSGALNEHFSDVFGSLVKQRVANEDAATANWLMGENVIVGKKYALRSLKAPGTAYEKHPVLGTDPQPATMDDFKELPLWEDRGGVHINSGIPNHAFYLAAIEIGGYAWKQAGLIWYRTLCDLLGENATFVRAAQATIQAARAEFGSGSLEEQAVTKAWKDVKVL
jgi:Zn-dependent metalloprotease